MQIDLGKFSMVHVIDVQYATLIIKAYPTKNYSVAMTMCTRTVLCLIVIFFATEANCKFSPQELSSAEEVRDFIWDDSKIRVLFVTNTEKICPGAVFSNG